MSGKLIEYVRKSINDGHSTETITQHLLEHGYSEAQVSEAFARLEGKPQQQSSQESTGTSKQGHLRFKHRNVVSVVLLFLFTAGIYPIYWYCSVNNSFRRQGLKDAPKNWMFILPLFMMLFLSIGASILMSFGDLLFSPAVKVTLIVILVLLFIAISLIGLLFQVKFLKCASQVTEYSFALLFIFLVLIWIVPIILIQLGLNTYPE